MNFNIVNTSLVVVGAILIYCGIKDISPKQALQEILTGSKANQQVGVGQNATGQGLGTGPGHQAAPPAGSGSW